jgi:hypothetical protein
MSLASNSENETPSVGDTMVVAKNVEKPTSTSVAMIDVNIGIVLDLLDGFAMCF